MITEELKDKGMICRGQGFHCPNCKDKVKCVDYEDCEVKEGQLSCCQCFSECKEIYQVKVINEFGEMSFEKVCSEECASELKNEMYHLHNNRAEEIQNQIIQRLK